jgi:Txe/YoeB family toxin of toxin-antitoxin system
LKYKIVYTKQAFKDTEKVKKSPFYERAKMLISIIKENPWQNPPEYEKLTGNYKGAYSRRLNKQHRLIYEVIESEQIIKIIAMWGHYE